MRARNLFASRWDVQARLPDPQLDRLRWEANTAHRKRTAEQTAVLPGLAAIHHTRGGNRGWAR